MINKKLIRFFEKYFRKIILLICYFFLCRDVDWQDNDGALNTITMTHLLLSIEHPNCLVEKESDCKPLYPGIWSVKLAPYILFFP